MSSIKSLIATASLMAVAVRSPADAGSGAFTLADLAGMETDEIQTLDSRLFPAGLFGVRCTSVILGMREAKEGINEKTGQPYLPVPFVTYKFEILEANPVDKKIESDKLIGRTLTDSITLWPDSIEEEIGVLKGNYKRIGLDNSGRLGGMEGGEPGWLDGANEHTFYIKVTHGRPNAEGVQRARIYWQKSEQNQEAA